MGSRAAEGPEETPGAGHPVFSAAAFQVADDGCEGMQTVAGADDADDKGLRVGKRLAVCLGAGPLQA